MRPASIGSKKSILPVKLKQPSTRGILPRERLFAEIDKGLRKKVVWISGPAGSGKTTLVAGFLNYRKETCLWYQLDEGDADPATFFYYMGIAAKIAAPGTRNPLPLLTPEYLQGIPKFAKRFFEQLSEIMTTGHQGHSPEAGPRATIVFDNYQDVPESSVFHAAVTSGIYSIPGGLNVIILSRTEPPPPFSRLKDMDEISFIGWKDIRFTYEESGAVAFFRRKRKLSADMLSQLYETTDGWAAGLVLFMESLGGNDIDYHHLYGLSREEIFSFFAAELFDRTPKEEQLFLLETSFLSDMNVRAAEQLTGNAKAGHFYAEFCRKNFFIHRYASQGQAFQYHPLFREFLQSRAIAIFTPDQLLDVKRRAAGVSEANGFLGDAVILYCESEQWDFAVRIIIAAAESLIKQGRWQTLQEWIDLLPDVVRENEPWLLFWYGICRFSASPDESRKYLWAAFGRFKGIRDAAGSFMSLTGLMDSYVFQFDCFYELDRLIAMMDELLDEFHRIPGPEIEIRVISAMLYALILRQPQRPDFIHWERRSLEKVGQTPDMATALHILCGLLFYRICFGEIEKADAIHELICIRVDTGQAEPNAVLSLGVIQALYYWLSADFEKCQWAVDNGLSLGESIGIHSFDILLLFHGTACLLSLGEASKAEQNLRKMHDALKLLPTAYNQSSFHILSAWCSLLQGNFTKSAEHADLGIHFCNAAGASWLIQYPYLVKSMAMLGLNNDEKVMKHLDAFHELNNRICLHQARFMAMLLEAEIAFEKDGEDRGKELLRSALALGKSYRFYNGFFWQNKAVAALCVKAIEAGIETAYVQDLIRRRNLVPDTHILHLENWPWPLSVHTLGQFQIARYGNALTFKGKVQQKPLLLLKALIAFGGKSVKSGTLCDALWPDADGDLAQRSFDITLHRLRQLAGKTDVFSLKEGRLSIDTQFCWIDAFDVQNALDEADSLWEIHIRFPDDLPLKKESAMKAVQLTQKAVDMYRGHFLDCEPEYEWLVSFQEKLKAKYTRGLAALAKHWEGNGEMEMAVRCYRRILDADELTEECYFNLMTIYSRMGQRNKVFEVYHSCRNLLSAKIGIEPSPKIQALYSALGFKEP